MLDFSNAQQSTKKEMDWNSPLVKPHTFTLLSEGCYPFKVVNFEKGIHEGDGEIRITKQGGIYFKDEFKYLGNDIWEQTGYIINDNEGDPELDTDTVRDGFISITPVLSGRTNMPVFEEIKNICK